MAAFNAGHKYVDSSWFSHVTAESSGCHGDGTGNIRISVSISVSSLQVFFSRNRLVSDTKVNKLVFCDRLHLTNNFLWLISNVKLTFR